MPAGYQPYLDICECQQDISHIWTFKSVSRISSISRLSRVPTGYQPYLDFCEEAVAKFQNVLKTVFIDSNTFKGNFIGNTSQMHGIPHSGYRSPV